MTTPGQQAPARRSWVRVAASALHRSWTWVWDSVEDLLFVATTAACFWMVWNVLQEGRTWWRASLAILVVWAILAYLALPRVNRILTNIYVPDYFIGRTRTGTGVLGDPINVALTGTRDQVATAMHAAGWTMAKPITLRSAWGIVVSALTGRSDPSAPVSSLFLFHRMQDFAFEQEVDGNARKRHHVRFWECPEDWLLPGGYRVDWLAAGSFDRAVGLSLFTLEVTHKIGADIDAERDHIVATVTSAEPSATVDVIRDFSTGYHSRNGGGDRVYTDGNLPILHLGSVDPDATVTAVAAQSVTVADVGARPPAVVLAVALSLLSTVVGVTTGLIADHSPAVVAITLTIAGALIVMAWLTYRGRRWARVTTLLLSALSFASHWGIDDHSLATLASMAIDLGIMYALTSSSARRWTLTPQEQDARVHSGE